ncbi:uncharacterized protein LOC126854820 isoform X2 [Cataglyphis hispanica]|uniref:uncharacterized protein LOC126854820 isoform X2 n=1 Tax=Cataglyphis hispanica TaxID=1086592 RepID=UPI00217FE526|nr:uncharacterized protein LOC126854820 isoform X2 [Cataglyphis hispanica]
MREKEKEIRRCNHHRSDADITKTTQREGRFKRNIERRRINFGINVDLFDSNNLRGGGGLEKISGTDGAILRSYSFYAGNSVVHRVMGLSLSQDKNVLEEVLRR